MNKVNRNLPKIIIVSIIITIFAFLIRSNNKKEKIKEIKANYSYAFANCKPFYDLNEEACKCFAQFVIDRDIKDPIEYLTRITNFKLVHQRALDKTADHLDYVVADTGDQLRKKCSFNFVRQGDEKTVEKEKDLIIDGFYYKSKEEKVFLDRLKSININQSQIKKLQDQCYSKFMKKISKRSYAKKLKICKRGCYQGYNKIDKLKPAISDWNVDISFNYNVLGKNGKKELYQYNCTYTKEGDLLKVMTVDENGINTKETELQKKYNF